ncbi:GH39 family glycosyl hydrolase [Lentilactobacillus kisonensis]|uniref:Carbohydrate binding module n=1 Tax=Lentilactobacillus kisonensis F0435 TaxID=797516 RepID=H1LII4_9LACO|nr:carbohydrate binding module [Lentilactobacillus kisonensis]EHO49713.1 carbohydrate binding module [Lentilactobacillus kisonensis F0435]
MVTAAQQNSDDVYAYELWNEPNANWNNSWGNFDQVWKDTYHVVKAIAPNAKILGPSLNGWNGGGWMKSFLTYCRDNNVLPDYICWHEWNAANFPKEAQALDAMEDSLGITRRPISINEYGWKNELAVPGQMIHYVQNFENVNELDSACLAFWYNYGRMDNLLTNDQKPNGGYWLYKWYGDMSGQMDQTSTFNTNGALASIANTTSDKGQTSVILGGTSGDTTVFVNNLDTSKYGKFAKVEVNATPWYGVDTAVDSPKTVASGTVAVNNGSVSIPVKDMKASSGYQVVVTPTTDSSATGVQYVQPSAGDPIRVEAEDSALFGAKTTIQTKSSYPSGNKYVSGIDDTQSGVTFKPNALAAGTYKVEVGYANGYQDSAVDSVTLNNKPLQDLTMPYTTGWLDDSLNVHGTRRVVQYGNVDLNKGENTFTLQKKSGFAELDYVQFTPVTPNPTPTPTPVNPDNSNTDQTSSSTNTSSSSSAASSSCQQLNQPRRIITIQVLKRQLIASKYTPRRVCIVIRASTSPRTIG